MINHTCLSLNTCYYSTYLYVSILLANQCWGGMGANRGGVYLARSSRFIHTWTTDLTYDTAT